jgi:hypothetical protein
VARTMPATGETAMVIVVMPAMATKAAMATTTMLK